MERKELILLVEDEKGIRNFISTVLDINNYRVIEARNGEEALELFTARCPNLIILDLGLPDIDGINVLKSIRSWSNIPIIVISARVDEHDKIEALDLGADDYITKPFGAPEMLARLRAALRHQKNDLGLSPKRSFSVGDIFFDFDKRLITVKGQAVHFTPIEYQILEILAQNPGKVITYDTIIKIIWGPYVNENQTLRVNMANIRRKIEDNPAAPKYILTEVGVGYRFVEEV